MRVICGGNHIYFLCTWVVDSYITLLILVQSDVNVKSAFDGATALHIAARYNCPEAATELIKNGADVAETMHNGQSPLHVCCRRGFLKVAKVIFQ